jgi:hypothetical protein
MSDFREADALWSKGTGIEYRLKEIERLFRPPTEEERRELLQEMEELKGELACVEEAHGIESLFIHLAMNGTDDAKWDAPRAELERK